MLLGQLRAGNHIWVKHSPVVHTAIFCIPVWMSSGLTSLLLAGGSMSLSLSPWKKGIGATGKSKPRNSYQEEKAAGRDEKSHPSMSCLASAYSRRNHRIYEKWAITEIAEKCTPDINARIYSLLLWSPTSRRKQMEREKTPHF